MVVERTHGGANQPARPQSWSHTGPCRTCPTPAPFPMSPRCPASVPGRSPGRLRRGGPAPRTRTQGPGLLLCPCSRHDNGALGRTSVVDPMGHFSQNPSSPTHDPATRTSQVCYSCPRGDERRQRNPWGQDGRKTQDQVENTLYLPLPLRPEGGRPASQEERGVRAGPCALAAVPSLMGTCLLCICPGDSNVGVDPYTASPP